MRNKLKEKERKKEQKQAEKQNKYNDEIKKKVEEWQNKKEEDEKVKIDNDIKNEQKRREKEKESQMKYEEQRRKIEEYKQQLRDKNKETIELLGTKNEKDLGALKHLKSSKIINRIDFGNEYHLPQIVRVAEMMEEEKMVWNKFIKQHKFNLTKTPRSRRLRKRSPLVNKNSENYFETNDAFTLTQGYFMSPMKTRIEADNIYKSNIELQKLK